MTFLSSATCVIPRVANSYDQLTQEVVVGSDVESQLVQTFKNIAQLKSAGADFHSVAQLTYHIVNDQP